MHDLILLFLEIAGRITYHARAVFVFVLLYVIASEIFLYDHWIEGGSLQGSKDNNLLYGDLGHFCFGFTYQQYVT